MSDLLIFIFVLGALLLGHELGHFAAARLRGVKVEEFGIGFPPRLATLFEAGGTKYTLNWIPFGGFVRPAGEDDPEVPGGLAAASKRTRATVLIAGPAANVLIAFVAFLSAFKFAAPDVSQVMITDVVDGTPAYAAGVREGDIVLNIDEVDINGFESMITTINSRMGMPTSFTILRDGEAIELEITPRVDFPEGQGPVGVAIGYPVRSVGWLEAARLSAETMGLQIKALVQLPGRLISGNASPEEARISGLKGIHDMLSWATAVDRSSDRPFVTLNMVGIISLGLAIANLLPIPALDGGRLMFIVIETILGRRLSPRLEGYAHAIGFVLLLALMVYFNLQDFVNPITLP